MRASILSVCLAATAAIGLTPPALAQSPSDQQRFSAALDRFNHEVALFQAEADRYQQASANRGGYRGGGGNGGGGGYYQPGPGAGSYPDDRYENGYDPSRYYRQGSNYQERRLAADDRVYRGSDGRYYCKRSDGTTGLIIGAASGGILGNVIDGGHSRTVGTLIGGALGAIAGKSIDQSNSDVRCR